MCFGSKPAQPQVNRPAYPVDQAYKAVQATVEPDNTPAPPPEKPMATPVRTASTGIAFNGR